MNPNNPGVLVDTEDLLVGDEAGNIYYYVIEWPYDWEVARDNWKGEARLVRMITIHKQQICGLAWSQKGDMFASGGNDNRCCLFDTGRVLARALPHNYRDPANGAPTQNEQLRLAFANRLMPGSEKHCWMHGAAVKAIAFCPWQEGLVATGGGSNDKCIHFFHTTSGSPLATISVESQVTSLIWSTTRREIAATFGYAQPEHPCRLAVFSWPDCRKIADIPWEGNHRALFAVPYPREACPKPSRGSSSLDRDQGGVGGDNEQHGQHGAAGAGAHLDNPGTDVRRDGCIVVASSDESVKFYEVWPANDCPARGGSGIFRGSGILESLEGIHRESGIIR